MKSFTVPQDIQLRDRLSGKDGDIIAFRAVALGRWANDSKAANSVAKLARWIKVVDKLDAAKSGDVIALEDDDHETLCDAVERDRIVMMGDPKAGPLIAAQLAPFYDAVTDAKEHEEIVGGINGAHASA